MRRLSKSLCLVAVLVLVLAVPVSAKKNPVISPEITEPPKTPETPTKKEHSPKTGDNSLVLYGAAMAAIAVAGSVVIANKKEA